MTGRVVFGKDIHWKRVVPGDTASVPLLSCLPRRESSSVELERLGYCTSLKFVPRTTVVVNHEAHECSYGALPCGSPIHGDLHSYSWARECSSISKISRRVE